ncbi:conserved hypothetical protein [Desulfamplus magnetovallimortis]|uniref:Glycosyl transferase family 1 domain-containing protein n=1 Tax=Desulfamplus magnetovallimortis TaxID=1246637 RepID=A0A1W1HD02_9BACT|nr:glycosyltransferase family 4 protein [Desulfamplus magnetovallimortis]SLM30350.1 conserved hypothetical protein [Desulfamplus magnetovallimortis]
MNACIFYHPEAYTTTGPRLMGRNAAGESFLRGFFAHSQTKEFWVKVQKTEHASHFAQKLQLYGRKETVKVVDRNSMAALKEIGVVYYPGPGIGKHSLHRAFFGHGLWSLCGITHTTSSAASMDALTALITEPVQPWDALICTSTAVKNNVERLLQAQVDYLNSRLGIARMVLPQLPIIPLGINTQDFVFTEQKKLEARKILRVTSESLVVLFMGRLSFHAKAHPLAMYQALEKAVQKSGKDVVLVECGWHANEYIARAYEEAARLVCPSVRVITLDGRKAEDRHAAWAGADIFCSLSDNIQETFGIVPIEAMAAGLPVVVSDWDGYRDTVRDGIDGFCIPTLMPGSGLGGDLAFRHALDIDTYDMYCGHTCSLVAVEVEAAAKAFISLFQSTELRRKMGDAGRDRAIKHYDWSVIIPQYEALWNRLNEIRAVQAINLPNLSRPWPARMDPFHAFGNYPTNTLTENTLLGLVDNDAETAFNRAIALRKLTMIDYARDILLTDDEVRSVLIAAADSPRRAVEIVAGVALQRQPFVFRNLIWLLKLGLLKIYP